MTLSDDHAIQEQAAVLCQQYDVEANRRTDRQFAVLMLLQWLAGIAVALWLSPRAWVGPDSQLHPHLFAAIFLGAATNLGPALLGVLNPGAVLTRHVIAVGQALSSALLIHLTGGRIETHFHVFGSLAFLSFYRDWRVLFSASAIVALDHFFRGLYWPTSIYGISAVTPWLSLEHTGWVIFEDIFLVRSIFHVRQAQQVAAMHKAQVEAANHAKSAFLAAMSHDLSTPLNGILGMNDLLIGTELTNRQRQFVDASRPSSLCDALMSTLAVTSVGVPQHGSDGSRAPMPTQLTGHVLVAEDNRINQMYVTELLKHCGCTCDVVANGDEVLEAIQRGSYDLLLLDCQMPEMDGFTAAREIRRRVSARELTPSIPIIALTANALKGDRERCLEAGMDDYLTKPLEVHQLRSKLEQYLPSIKT